MFDWPGYGRGLAGLARPGETLRIEPGRAVTAYCGWYLTRVLDVKHSHGEAFAVGRGEESFDVLTVTLKYADDRRRVIQGIKRISKPGRRIYAKADRLPKVLGGLGTAIMSTPVGVITSRQAAERGIGGEVLCFVW